MNSAKDAKGQGDADAGKQRTRLDDCPNKPNCVCSQASRDDQQIEPLAFTGSASDAMQVLLNCLRGFPRTKIREQTANYVHVTFRTAVFQFVDDGEFLLDSGDQNSGVQKLHMRSASRIGYSDMGANRKRLEKLRSRLIGTGVFQ